MMGRIGITVLLVTVAIVGNRFDGVRADSDVIRPIVDACCESGTSLANRTNSCIDYQPPANVSDDKLSTCFFSSHICCEAKLRIEQCKAGIMAGKEGLACEDSQSGFYTGCCEACKIGLVYSSAVSECPLPDMGTFGVPFDDALQYCCREMKSADVFYITEGEEPDFCGRSQKLCSQLCVNTLESYVCKCEPGYHLLDDKVTCLKDDGVDDEGNDNSVTDDLVGSSSDGCPPGFMLHADGEECEDINECETGYATCDNNTQHCQNEPGSYKCLDILTNGKHQTSHDAPTICAPGLRYNTKTDECDDINECDSNINICPSTTRCENTRGGYNCVQKVTATSAAPSTSRATGNPLLSGRNRNTCATGYKLVLDKCVDIDECSADRSVCASNQNCINTPGAYRCDCKIGWTLDRITQACVDINECQINNHDCLESQRCDNTIGSYSCIRLQSCGTGYTLNAGTGQCDDDDECVLNRHNCLKPYECRNTKGSFRCERPRTTTTSTSTSTTTTTTTTTSTARPATAYARTPPYSSSRLPYESYPARGSSAATPYRHPTTVHSSSRGAYTTYQPAAHPTPPVRISSCGIGLEHNEMGACVDIDECLTRQPCRRGQRCTNTNGSYRCDNLLTCSGGYEPNDEGTRCIDIDECASGEARCAADQTCTNKQGGYTCACPSGYAFRNQRCEDIDECVFYRGQVCPSNANCRNTAGAYVCDCHRGFRKQSPDDKVCTDIDECREQPRLCAQQCVNMWGSHRCSCGSGYELAADNRTCVDVDECQVHHSYNLCMGECENTPGSFRCSCPEGYQLGADGRSCVDIDECASRSACRHENDICTNVRGSYRCTSIQCPSDFMQDPDRKNRCKRMSMMCERGDIACFERPLSYVYNFIVLTANMTVPPRGRALFTLTGPTYYDQLDFNFELLSGQRRQASVRQTVDKRFFRLETSGNECVLHLVKTLFGPQDVEIELQMTAYRNGQMAGRNVQMILLIVSEHEF